MLEKFDSRRFYVGELNFSFSTGNLNGHNAHRDDLEKEALYRKTIRNGAIELNADNYNLNPHNNRSYKSVFTLFYKLDNGKLLCLHNGKEYSIPGNDFYANVFTFDNLLPKLDYEYPRKLSYHEACWLFGKAFNHKISLNNNKYSIDNFYTGTTELCVSGEKDGFCQNINLIDSILLDEDYIKDGSPITLNGTKYNFKIYKSLFYLFDNGTMYNLSNYQIYEHSRSRVFEGCIELGDSFRSVLEQNNISCGDDTISIPKALKLQKKLRTMN